MEALETHAQSNAGIRSDRSNHTVLGRVACRTDCVSPIRLLIIQPISESTCVSRKVRRLLLRRSHKGLSRKQELVLLWFFYLIPSFAVPGLA